MVGNNHIQYSKKKNFNQHYNLFSQERKNKRLLNYFPFSDPVLNPINSKADLIPV